MSKSATKIFQESNSLTWKWKYYSVNMKSYIVDF